MVREYFSVVFASGDVVVMSDRVECTPRRSRLAQRCELRADALVRRRERNRLLQILDGAIDLYVDCI